MISIKKNTPLVWNMPLTIPQLRAAMQTMLCAIDRPNTTVELILTDDDGIAQLNESFLACHGPTNILSFPTDEQGMGPDLGTLALSLDALEREIFLYGQNPTEHAFRLLAHGLLHLAGHDHGELMFTLTEEAVSSALHT